MNCFKPGCGQDCEPSYVHAVVGELGIGVGELLAKPLTHLERYLVSARAVGSSGQRAPLPDFRECHRWLKREPERMRHLTDDRGLRPETIDAFTLGWDGHSYVIPVPFDGIVQTAVRYRPWRAKRRYVVLKGRGSWLYPEMPPGRAVVLVAGMMDALIGRQTGLPTVTMTCGKTLPPDEALSFTNLRVAVAYDAGEEESAAHTVERLKPYVDDAWVVPLPLPSGGDVADWFVEYGRSREELLELIRKARP